MRESKFSRTIVRIILILLIFGALYVLNREIYFATSKSAKNSTAESIVISLEISLRKS